MTKREAMHRWRFFRAGGFDQVQITTGADLLALDELDQKLWVALACPLAGIDFDKQVLEYLDADHDGRIRADDILNETRWLGQVLKDPEVLVAESDSVPFFAIDSETAEGAALLVSARRVLANLGKPDAVAIALDEAKDAATIFAAMPFNGDGVVTEAVSPDDDLKALIKDIVACQGGVADRSGEPGVNLPAIAAFYGGIEAAGSWLDEAAQSETILALGDDTEAANAALEAVAEKIDGFFLRCALAAFSGAAAAAMNPSTEVFAPLADKPLAESYALLRPLPLADIEAGASLPLGEGINPAWRDEIAAFNMLVVEPLLGARDTLSKEDWDSVKSRLAPFAAWRSRRPSGAVAGLDPQRIRAITAGSDRPRLEALVAEDLALESEAASIDAVHRLLVMRRGLFKLVNNFVSFRDFYTKRDKAVFQAGTLYLDGRSADLCVRVQDAAEHATLAALARLFLVYCECRRASGEKMVIAAAITAGEAEQLMVGRNGVFYDRDGRDWDATILQIVTHPISLGQAFWSPYRYLGQLVSGQIDKLAAAKDKALQAQMGGLVGSALTAPALTAPALVPAAAPVAPAAAAAHPAPPAPAPIVVPFDVARFAGIFATIGLAIGAIGTAVVSLITGFLKLSWWQMPLALAGLLVIISGPAMISAYIKLRQRNLGPILDACGWAINAQAKINIPFGRSLTALAHLPRCAVRSLSDPFAERRRWPYVMAALAIIVLAAAAVAVVLVRFRH